MKRPECESGNPSVRSMGRPICNTSLMVINRSSEDCLVHHLQAGQKTALASDPLSDGSQHLWMTAYRCQLGSLVLSSHLDLNHLHHHRHHHHHCYHTSTYLGHEQLKNHTSSICLLLFKWPWSKNCLQVAQVKLKDDLTH